MEPVCKNKTCQDKFKRQEEEIQYLKYKYYSATFTHTDAPSDIVNIHDIDTPYENKQADEGSSFIEPSEGVSSEQENSKIVMASGYTSLPLHSPVQTHLNETIETTPVSEAGSDNTTDQYAVSKDYMKQDKVLSKPNTSTYVAQETQIPRELGLKLSILQQMEEKGEVKASKPVSAVPEFQIKGEIRLGEETDGPESKPDDLLPNYDVKLSTAVQVEEHPQGHHEYQNKLEQPSHDDLPNGKNSSPIGARRNSVSLKNYRKHQNATEEEEHPQGHHEYQDKLKQPSLEVLPNEKSASPNGESTNPVSLKKYRKQQNATEQLKEEMPYHMINWLKNLCYYGKIQCPGPVWIKKNLPDNWPDDIDVVLISDLDNCAASMQEFIRRMCDEKKKVLHLCVENTSTNWKPTQSQKVVHLERQKRISLIPTSNQFPQESDLAIYLMLGQLDIILPDSVHLVVLSCDQGFRFLERNQYLLKHQVEVSPLAETNIDDVIKKILSGIENSKGRADNPEKSVDVSAEKKAEHLKRLCLTDEHSRL